MNKEFTEVDWDRLYSTMYNTPISYFVFWVNEEIDPRTLFSTKTCFGSEKATRVMHVELNSLYIDIGEKKNCPNLDRRLVPG